MIKIALFFTLGCVTFLQLNTMPSLLFLGLALPACILLKFKLLRPFFFFILGGLWCLFFSHLILSDRLFDQQEGVDLSISGTISSIPKREHSILRFEFQTDNPDLPLHLRLNWYQPLPDDLRAGERWQLTVRLKKNNGMMDPGAFDYEGWLFQRHIGATGYVRHHQDNHRLAIAPPYSINALRQNLIEAIDLALPNSPHIGLIHALTTGVKHAISPKQWQILSATGTNHLLAISGLHIGLAALIGFMIGRFLWSLRANNLLLLTATDVGAIASFIFALFYAALAGFSLPTQRALIMVTTVMIALIIRRPIIPSHVLSVSLILILLANPLSVLSASFWLSFSAVAIILFVSQYRYPTPKWQWLKIHIVIAFGLSPFLLLFFMKTSLIAPLANIIAIPFISFIVVPLLLLICLLFWLSCLFICLWQDIGASLLYFTDQLLTLFWLFIDTLAQIPFSSWQGPSLPYYYYLPVILGCALLLLPRYFPAKYIGVLGFIPLLFWSPDKPNQDEFWFTLLDVGQGLSAVIQTTNHTLVFDAGAKLGDSFNTGTAIVEPFLHQQGVQTIDKLVISHGDNDHIGGAIPLINKMSTLSIVSSVPSLLPNATPCIAGDSWHWDGVDFLFLHPSATDNGSENNLSCVLKISNTAGSLLLTGDIEVQTERLLIARYADTLASSVLIVPHHGSNTSSSSAFLAAVSPELALFPLGYNNRHHFPHPAVIQRYQDRHINTLNTAEHGAISIQFNSDFISPAHSWRRSNHKIWTQD